MISDALYPLIRSAPEFQLVMMPSGLSMKNRVLPHAVDQEPEPLLALPRCTSSAARRSVRSRVILMNPAPMLSAGRSAVITTLAQNRDAVLAHPPALVGEASVLNCHPQLIIGPTLGQRLGRIEGREVPADDLLALVALDPTGAVIPAGDAARAVQQKDGVVLDVSYEQL